MIKKIFSTAAAIALFSTQNAFAQGAAQQLTSIGAAGAVAGRVTALAPTEGAIGRVLSSGKEVYFKDTIATGARGRLQIMLADQTVFTIGPDSEMLIDEFVYVPFTDTGKVAAQVTKGVFRFVTGKIARKKPSAMNVKLPNGTIGIRGTLAAGKINADGSSIVALLGPGTGNTAGERPGSVDITNAGETVTLLRPGFATIIRPGAPPTPPFQLSPDQMAQLELKPAAEAGGGDPDKSQDDAKRVGQLGETKKVSTIVGGEGEETRKQNDIIGFAIQEVDFDDPNIINWDAFRAAAPTSSNATYSGNGTYTCTGGVCGASGSGDWTAHFEVDWVNKTVGGGGTNSHVAFQVSTGGPLCPSGCSSEYGSNIDLTNFSQLGGDAQLIQGQHYAGTNSEFNGSGLQFNNQPNTFTGILKYVGQGSSADSTLTGSCSGTCP